MTDTTWKAKCEKLSREEFFEAMVFPPIKRMGFEDGPGAVFHGEPWNFRVCSVTKKLTKTRNAHFVIKDENGEPEYFRVIDPITLEEFKAMCEIVIPGVGPCALGWGRDL
jgi:hypothetical protein